MSRWAVRKVEGEWRIYHGSSWHDTEYSHTSAITWALRMAVADLVMSQGRVR